ncbi:hypothetical protein CcrColossus_gp232 [Caulobacter phage CcrColossus]|uniref:Uncharacterized protein n=1 Tax=Caulobacter phage CcrColossus TaxID=1211640 RepID=K4K6D5_9CAUD|nr:hypothetical protein CcrColossus_gp232 [Caulobacter phage CcrColossus]AFU88102.1 hypothetical protein CcrColossus_gp232 [Caulobacter phage CcrColossus]
MKLAILLAATLIATPALAQCPIGGNCMSDPQAWKNMFGASPAQRAEQSSARRAAESVIQDRQTQANADLLGDMGQVERYRLTYSVEDTLTRLSGAPTTVLRATVLARGGGYLFCGSALYGQSDNGIFVLDTRPGGIATLHASKDAFIAAGCGQPATILR